MLDVPDVLQALRSVNDPDLHTDVVQAGFIHDVHIDADGAVSFELRLTTPACPVKDLLQQQAHDAVRALPGVSSVSVRLTAEVRGRRAAKATHAALEQVEHVVAVTSGKGGVGKSSTTVNLAVALAGLGARVGVVDADVHGPSVAHLMGVGPPDEVGEAMVPPQAHGVAVASMAMFVPAKRPLVLRGPRVAGVLQQLLGGFAWGRLDYLLVDCPPGTGDVQLSLAQQTSLSGAVVVTTPQQLAVNDVQRAIEMLRMVDVPLLGLVETMSGFVCPSCEERHPIFADGGGERLARSYDVPLLGQIPLDPRVVTTSDAGVPVVTAHPGSAAAQAYLDTAMALAARLSVASRGGGDQLEHFELRWERA